MSEIIENIQSIAQKIHKIESENDRFAEIFFNLKYEIDFKLIPSLISNDISEDRMVYNVSPTSLSGLSIVGIDGGVISKSFYNFDLIASRAVACIFKFDKNKPYVDYFPNKSPIPNIIPNLTPSNQNESEIFISLERLSKEIELAILITKRPERPNIIILDGSILPLPNDKPNYSSKILIKYQQVIEKYRILFESCIENNIMLVGCVKDSRSKRFISFLGKIIPNLINYYPHLNFILDLDYRGIIQRIYDCELLYRILDVNERTCVLSYSNSPDNHNILKDFDEKLVQKLKIFYLKS